MISDRRRQLVEPDDNLRQGAGAQGGVERRWPLRRFHHIEAELTKDGRTPEQSDLAEMDALWNAAKAIDKAGR